MRVIMFSLLLSISSISIAQVFSGQVIDNQNGQPIMGAVVYISELEAATVTDEFGNFTIDDHPGTEMEIQISFLGYETMTLMIDLNESDMHTFRMIPGHFDLEEILISTPMGNLRNENVVLVQVDNLDRLYDHGALTITEALTTMPGVERLSTGQGIGKPVIRGLSSNRVITYVQGIRMENQQWGGEHGLGISDVGLGNIELIKGPASLLYGSDALGGVLYINDERFADLNTVHAGVGSTYYNGTIGSDNQVFFKINKKRMRFNLFSSLVDHDNYSTGAGTEIQNSGFNGMSNKLAFGFNNQNWRTTLRSSIHRYEFGISEEGLSIPFDERGLIYPKQTTDDVITSWSNKFHLDKSDLEITLGHTFNKRKEFEETDSIMTYSFYEADTSPALHMDLHTVTYNLKWIVHGIDSSWNIALGSQGLWQQNKNLGEEILIPNGKTTDFGLFGMLNRELGNFNLQLGLRADVRKIDTEETEIEHDDHGGHDHTEIPALRKTYASYSYSAGLSYARNSTRVLLNLSSGFRSPNTSELLSNGVHHGTGKFEIGNTGLGNELANQIDLAVEFSGEHMEFTIQPFMNYIQDYIYLNPLNYFDDGFPVYQYVQGDASLAGGEFYFHWHPHAVHWLHVELDYSTVYGWDENGDHLPLIPADRIRGNLKAEFAERKNNPFKDVFVESVYRLEQNRIATGETTTPAYMLLNAGVGFDFQSPNAGLELRLGVNNILNEDHTDHLSAYKYRNINEQGINPYIKLLLDFSGKLKQK